MISVYYKDNLEPVIHKLAASVVEFISTGGTQEFIKKLGYEVTPVETLTGYPEIFGGRVKTLHPAVFGGILFRRDHTGDQEESVKHKIAPIDLVMVDLYPFEETVSRQATPEEIVEKIDIGGISLIRAAAKNFNDVLIVSSREQYGDLLAILEKGNCSVTLGDRHRFAAAAFEMTSHYDTAIFSWFNREAGLSAFKSSQRKGRVLRYGENPHQRGVFYGDLDNLFDQLNGKELSYNNLVDTDAALRLVAEFPEQPAFVIIKHTNACGVATGADVRDAYLKALQADPVSAFGGILVTNRMVDLAAATEMNSLFFEILIAPEYSADALELLRSKKNRIILRQKEVLAPATQFKNLLNGVIEQDADSQTDQAAELRTVTRRAPSSDEISAMLFASKICKHTKSNAIILAKNGQLLASGVGQTSRVDALRQAIEKAGSFKMELKGAVMASDAFFPFPDCVEIAAAAGIEAILQPGGSVKDQDSVDACDQRGLAMVMTGRRHFLH
ncbi:MAG: bifunctional phosphoribosylaminoimidazolecarboxamide formyltransferase/IMP cyclohydrolase [Bacteroidota bacterium]